MSVPGAPFVHDRSSTASTMWQVSLALAPAAVWGAWLLGVHAVLVLIVAIAAGVGGEWLATRLFRRGSIGDGSAFLTGMLVGMIVPSGAPLYAAASASLFAIFVVKWSFGGLGGNWMNPALAGVVFAFYCWPKGFAMWSFPRLWHAPSSVAPLPPLLYTHAAGAGRGPIAALAHYPSSQLAAAVSKWLSATLHLRLDPHLTDLFLGIVPGSIGEVSTLLLIAGAVFLLVRRVIRLALPLSYLLSFLGVTWLVGGLQRGGGFAVGELYFHLFTGSIVLAAFFALTDPVTSPSARRAKIYYGVGAGLLTFVLQRFGSAQEAFALAVILMNITVPAIDRATNARRTARREAVSE